MVQETPITPQPALKERRGDAAAPAAGSITRWLGDLRDGDELAAQRLWERYFVPLTRLAGKLLPEFRRQAVDEEDLALSALGSLFDQLRAGHLPDLCDRGDLWRWLAVVTGRKAINGLRHELRQKRGGDVHRDGDPASLISGEPPPGFELIVSEEFQRLLNVLGDDTLKQIALWKLDDVTNDEIAARLGCCKRTVARKLSLIRKIWEGEVP